ncbi:L-dopachrome tautomerase-related protein [Caballeronia sp. LZ035]|uniref:SMP-30/gluconolactonase/LRE family protein n=1 Tax=Caballeronia sp. LZ035 TaxID=3038568 RepID=UPI00285890D0|nr:L-dopachrome tautomerase-related protein [Caballeronia sp. LZ035]MDR5761268.1 L-dopachrome tautomerase-related protein [Caballeronia sp. LZ035]
MQLNRRAFLSLMAATGACLAAPRVHAQEAPLTLNVAVRSPWMANQVALTRSNWLFLGLPRYARDTPTPSLARREPDGRLVPFPGNAWNDWQPGDDGRDAFVYLNSVHIFADDTVWCVDQGSLSPDAFPHVNEALDHAAQKVVRLDAQSGKVLDVLRFDDTILPPGAQLNDLRFHGSTIYLTDSGLGGIIVHDRATGKTVRRLSGDPHVKASLTEIPSILAHVKGGKTFHPPNSDMIEITSDGKWLYWAAPTGPLVRIETRFLNDATLSDAQLAARVEHVFDNRFSGGCCMDSAGNVYFSETVTHHITVLSPQGRTAVLASDPTLVRPDGSFISHDRHLYIPVKQPIVTNAAHQQTPYVIYSIALPEHFDGIALGGPVTGA